MSVRGWSGISITAKAVVPSKQILDLECTSNVSLVKSPTPRVRTQSNPVFLSIVAVFKLEYLNIKHKTNPFVLRMKRYIKATQSALVALRAIQKA